MRTVALAAMFFLVGCPNTDPDTDTDAGSDTDSEVVIDLCADEPCDNGSCMSDDDAYVCDCDPGWEGTDCDVNTDDCTDDACGEGTCIDGIDTFTCECDDGWTGADCTENIDECAGDPCQNAGVCTDGINSFTCDCTDGWDGDMCTDNIDDCADTPCDEGTCVDGIASFTCDCDAGWEGDLCETEVDECAADPCANAVQCIDQLAAFTCICEDGWEGELCDTDIDECADDPCANGGTCNDGLAQFTCDCVTGWEGDLCDENPDDCPDIEQCIFGDCEDGVAEWTCACDEGWDGDLCDVDIDECALSDACPEVDELCVNEPGDFVCAPVVLVNPDTTPGGNGLTWETAFASVEEALTAGHLLIWVKQGTLTPSAANAPVIDMPPGAVILGGFDPGLTGRNGDPDTRDPAARTVLSGAFDTELGNNSRHVVVGNRNATLDGFAITGGVLDTAEDPALGAGVVVQDASGMTLENLDIDDNRVTLAGWAQGGGVACVDSTDVWMSNITVTNNDATSGQNLARGGGLFFFQCEATVVDAVIDGNTIRSNNGAHATGGGVFVEGGDVGVDNVIVQNNAATGANGSQNFPISATAPGNALGGGAYVNAQLESPWVDVVLTGNSATAGHGVAGNNGGTSGGIFGCFLSVSSPGTGGGIAGGGGLYVHADATMELIGGESTANTITPGNGGPGGRDLGPSNTDCGGDRPDGPPGRPDGGGLYAGGDVVWDWDVATTLADNLSNGVRPCPVGFGGYACEENLDDCAIGDDPLGACGPNAAECIDGISDFTCVCAGGWEGPLCTEDVDVDDCLGVTSCETDEVCIDEPGAFRCEDATLVDPSLGAGGDGSTWETAYGTIQEALDTGASAIWVKSGSINPAASTAPIIIATDKARIYGSFSPSLTGRDGDVNTRDLGNLTVLDGDFDGSPATQSSNVVRGARGFVLDGFRIRDGRALTGGGILLQDDHRSTLRNLVIEENNAVGGFARGGGLYCTNTFDLTLENLTVQNNRVQGLGTVIGGGLDFRSCDASLDASTVANNTVISDGLGHAYGGGLAIELGDVWVSNTILSGNTLTGGLGGEGLDGREGNNWSRNGASGGGGGAAQGAGVYLDGASTAPWTDVVLSGNMALGGQGGVGGDGEVGTRSCGYGGDGGPGGVARGAGLFGTTRASVNLLGGSVTGNGATGGSPAIGGIPGPAFTVEEPRPGGGWWFVTYHCLPGDTGAFGVAEGAGIYALGAVTTDVPPTGNVPDDRAP